MAEADTISQDISVECEETSSVTRSIRVVVATSRVNRAFDRAYKELAKGARIKGFRPGKTPRSVLERMYGASMPEDLERILVMETLADAIEQAKVVPLTEPDIDAESPAQGNPFCYTARVEIKPEIELPDLGELKAKQPVVLVSEERVDAELERLRMSNAHWVEESEDVEAANGHTVSMDFVGKVDGETFPGGTGEGMDIELGSGGMVPGFEDQLVGVKAGDDRQIEVTFPDDYGPETLNGKDATFACHIVAIRRREVPELDDEFAKDLGEEFETLEQLRDDIREKITEGDERLSEQALHRSLMSSLIELSEFDVPGGIVDQQLESQLRSMHEQYHGRVPEDVLHGHLDRMQEEGRPMAERRVREQLLLEELAKAHDISADEADVDARLEEMAAARGIEVSQLRSMAEKQGWLDALSTEARDMKIYALLSEQAEIEKVYEENEPDD